MRKVLRIPMRARTAYHEAGHAVAAYLVRRRIIRVSIVPDSSSTGHVETAPITIDVNISYKNKLEKEIIILFGGQAAVITLKRRLDRKERIIIDKENDTKQILNLIQQYMIDENKMDKEQAISYINQLWLHTREELISDNPNWYAVRVLARELMKYKKLDGIKVKKIIQEAIVSKTREMMSK